MRRWWLVGLLGMSMLVTAGITVLAQGVGGAEEGARAEPSPVQELAERLLAPPVPGPDGRPQTAQLLPGQLPPDLPLPALPPDGRLLGSVERGPGGKATGADVVLDAPGEAAELLGFYQRELAALGWTTPPVATGPRGFQAAAPATGIFCQSPSGPWLSVNVFARPSGPSDVRLHLETANPGPCGQTGPPKQPPGMDRLPLLYAPPGVILQAPGGSGGGPNRFTSEATAETTMGAAELEAHFAEQLRAAGWTRQAGQAEGPLAWSSWTVPGEGEWYGFLYALEAPGQNRRSLHVRVESATASAPGPHPVAPAPAAPIAPPAIAPPAPRPSP